MFGRTPLNMTIIPTHVLVPCAQRPLARDKCTNKASSVCSLRVRCLSMNTNDLR